MKIKIRKIYSWKDHTWYDNENKPYEWGEGKPMSLYWVIAYTMGHSKISVIRRIGWTLWGAP